MDFTVLVPFFNGHATISRLLDTLPDSVPVLIVDDHSDEPLQLDRKGVRVIRPPEKGFFSGAVNTGMQNVYTDVLILNQDVWFADQRWLKLLEEKSQTNEVIGDGVMRHPAWPKGYVQGTFMFIQRDAWRRTGKLNEQDYPLWGSTCEWQLRACRKGFRVLPLHPIPGMRHQHRKRFGSSIETALERWPDRRQEFIRTPPEISVIIPCYNYGEFLDDAVNSLIGGQTCLGPWEPQTFQSFEIIIVDDDSTDEATREKVQALHDPWKGIRSYFLDKNHGTPVVLNVGIEQSFGQFIHILSADDMRENWALEKQYRAAIRYPNHAIYGNIQMFNAADGRFKVGRLSDYDFDQLLYKNCMPAGITYPKKAWEDVGGYHPRMEYGREDWAFNVALGIKGYCGYKMEGLSGNLYRRQRQNRSLRNQGPTWRQRFLSQVMSLFPQIYEGERPVGCCGGRSRITPSRRSTRSVEPTEMKDKSNQGLRLLEFVGLNSGSATYYGPVTGSRYKFGNNDRDRIKYVAVEDYQAMLKLYKSKRPLFSAYVTPQPAPDIGVDEKEDGRVNPEEKTEPVKATQAAMRLAAETGLDLTEIKGTGSGGKIIKPDVEAALEMA